MDDLWLRSLHVLGAVVLLGLGLGSAFHFWFVSRSAGAPAIAEAARAVVWADWLFIAPAVVLQPLTGLALATELGHPLDSDWLLAAIALYLLAGACWLPVVGLQIRIARLAKADALAGRPLGPEAARLIKRWFWLGWPAFGAILVVLHLMVFRPEGWLPGAPS